MEVILDAAQRVGAAARVLLVGDGSEKPRLMQQARALGLENVTFLDAQPVDEVPRLLALSRAAVISVAPAEVLRTARPAQMFPAMGCGKPIILSGAGEAAAMVRHAECGIVVPPGDPDALAGAVRELASDPERAQRLGANGRAFVEREFGWHRLVADWLDALLENGHGPHRRGATLHEVPRTRGEFA
jgi:glycosyltransferase involved in cell wall biosynthesis